MYPVICFPTLFHNDKIAGIILEKDSRITEKDEEIKGLKADKESLVTP